MKFLIIDSIYHPEELAKAQENATPGESILFPPSQGTYFLIRSLRKLGHQVDAFVRNAPILFGKRNLRLERFTGVRSLATLMTALSLRLPRAHPDFRLRNRRLLATVAAYEPDIILMFGNNRVVFPETLAAIKSRYGCKVVYLGFDSPLVFSRAIERTAAPLYDLVLVNDYYHGTQWLDLGATRMEVLPISACDPEFHHPYTLSASEQVEFACEVGFVGTLLPPNLYSLRIKALEAIKDCGLGVWSIHDLPSSLQPYYRGQALGEKMLRVLCGSKIQVNPHGDSMRYGGNMRLFEAAACGIFQIADDLPGISKWFTPGETIATYHSTDHLRKQVAYYLKHDDERQGIALQAQAHVYANHTYDQRMATLVSLLE